MDLCIVDENKEGGYNKHKKGVAGRRSAPLGYMRNPASCEGLGGLSYAFNATIQIVTMNSNAKKSYSSNEGNLLIGVFVGVMMGTP